MPQRSEALRRVKAMDREIWQDGLLCLGKARYPERQQHSGAPGTWPTFPNHVALYRLLSLFELCLIQGDLTSVSQLVRRWEDWAAALALEDLGTHQRNEARESSHQQCSCLNHAYTCLQMGQGDKDVLNDLHRLKAATPKRTHLPLEVLWSRMKVTGPKLEGLRFELRTGTGTQASTLSFTSCYRDDFGLFSKLETPLSLISCVTLG